MTDHSLSMLVHSHLDVLSRTVVLFATRSVEVKSLSFRPAGQSGVSRLDVVISLVEGREVDQLVKQLYRLVDVLRVVESMTMLDQLGA